MKEIGVYFFTKSDEWVKFEDETTADVGVSGYAQSELGDLVYVNLPQEDDEVTAGEVFTDVESVKAVSDVYCPVTGVIGQVNEELLDAPEMINESPAEAYFAKITDITEVVDVITE